MALSGIINIVKWSFQNSIHFEVNSIEKDLYCIGLPIVENLPLKEKCIHAICIVHVDPCIVDTDAWILLLDMFH